MSEKSKSKQKQPTKEKIDKEIKETKAEAFLRIAKPRVESILKAIRILGNCSNKNSYGYTSEQIDKIFNTINKALNEVQAKFTKSKKELERFEF